MLLTVFYMAATWMQAWRLSSIKKKLLEYTTEGYSLVFFKVPVDKAEIDDENIILSSASSSFCQNKNDAMMRDLLWFTSSVRACSLSPTQYINVNNWISFSDQHPLSFVSTDKLDLPLTNPRLFLLLESLITDDVAVFDLHSFSINQFGIPRAWRADDTLGVLLESDMSRFSELASGFLTQSMALSTGLELVRIQTVSVEGRPCLIHDTNTIALTNSPLRAIDVTSPSKVESEDSSPTDKYSKVEILRRFSQSAEVASEVPSAIPGIPTLALSKGNKSLDLHSPTKIEIPDIPEDIDEEIIKISQKTEIKINEQKVISSSTAGLAVISTVGAGVESNEPVRMVVSAQSTPSRHISSHINRKDTFSSIHSLGSASTMSVRSTSSGKMKPPNILVYSESPITTENIKAVLNETLHRHKYTIYSVTTNQLASSAWAHNCALLVVCGNVPEHVECVLTEYLLQGGRLFCLCSSFLHSLLPTFRTAEVRERELVRFTYGKWNRVRLMHHVFCYQNSPVRTRFSREADDPPNEKDRVSPVPQTPSSVDILDRDGKVHTLRVQVLGAEETWQTPSLLLAYFASPGGRVVFSQVHLEIDPSQSLEDGEALRSSDMARKEIIKDLLSTHLGLECGSGAKPQDGITAAYFLGKHETKLQFLGNLKEKKQDNTLRVGNLNLKFCGKGETPPRASSTLLPVMIHACPRDFSTLEYFENLETESIGRLLIYCEIMGSSMDVLGCTLAHGLAVVPSQQTSGKGRSSNQWLSPPGCAMFSLQLHFPLDSYIGQHASIVQHLTSVAVVSAVSDISPQYSQALDLRLKWPNDVYTGDLVKVGGVIANCSIQSSDVVINIGCGINLNNDSPTTCLNTLITEYNKNTNNKLIKLTREKLLARIFTRIEQICERLQEGDVQYLHSLYYQYWLHSGAEVYVIDGKATPRAVTITGIDEFGFLKVVESTGKIVSVQPDGNSFDMMEGLIAPKLM